MCPSVSVSTTPPGGTGWHQSVWVNYSAGAFRSFDWTRSPEIEVPSCEKFSSGCEQFPTSLSIASVQSNTLKQCHSKCTSSQRRRCTYTGGTASLDGRKWWRQLRAVTPDLYWTGWRHKIRKIAVEILPKVNNRTQILREILRMVIIDIVINSLLDRLTLDPASMHCPAWDDAFVSSFPYFGQWNTSACSISHD